MATMDIIKLHGGAQQVKEAFEIITGDPKVKLLVFILCNHHEKANLKRSINVLKGPVYVFFHGVRAPSFTNNCINIF